MHRSGSQRDSKSSNRHPGAGIFFHVRPNRPSPGRSPEAWSQGRGNPDKSNRTDKYSAAVFLLHAGIPTRIDAAHAIAHNKIMVIDGETVITGSFNFTRAAEEKNAENLLIISDKSLAEKYISNWKLHARHSEVYKGREGKDFPKRNTVP